MAYAAFSVVYGETPTAAKWNILGTNDASFNDGTGIADGAIDGDHIADGSITNAMLNTTAGDIGGAAKDWTPSPTGFTGAVAITVASYTQIGKWVFLTLSFSGTSNATTCGFTLPVSPKNTDRHICVRNTDNGIIQSTPGLMVITASDTAATVGKNMSAGAGWTNSGVKAVAIHGLIYEAA